MKSQLVARRAAWKPRARSLASVLALTIATACVPADPPREAPLPAAPAPLAEASTTVADLHLQIMNVERVGEAVLEVSFALTNTAGAGQPFVPTSEFASHPEDSGSIADVSLVDASGRRRSFVIRDAQSRPACSTGIAPIPPGVTRELWARFLAPPPNVTRVRVQFPRVPVVLEVPIVGSRVDR